MSFMVIIEQSVTAFCQLLIVVVPSRPTLSGVEWSRVRSYRWRRRYA